MARSGVEHEANLPTIQRCVDQHMVVLDFNGHRICGGDLSGCGTGRIFRRVFLDRMTAADDQPQHWHRQSQSNRPQAVHALLSLIAYNISAVAPMFDFARTLPFPSVDPPPPPPRMGAGARARTVSSPPGRG